MPSQATVHMNDVGTTFIATVKNEDGDVEDISDADDLVFIFRKPNGTELEVEGVLTSGGTDGKYQYQTVDGDIDMIGIWKLQGVVTIGSNVFHTNIHRFRVTENL